MGPRCGLRRLVLLRIADTEFVSFGVPQDRVGVVLVAHSRAECAKPLDLDGALCNDKVEMETVPGSLRLCGLLKPDRWPRTIQRNRWIRLRGAPHRGKASNLGLVVETYRVPVQRGLPEASEGRGVETIDRAPAAGPTPDPTAAGPRTPPPGRNCSRLLGGGPREALRALKPRREALASLKPGFAREPRGHG